MDVQEGQGSPAAVDDTPRSSRGKAWIYGAVILCCYGFFKEFKPSEPFLTPYLVDYKNFTKDEVGGVPLLGVCYVVLQPTGTPNWVCLC